MFEKEFWAYNFIWRLRHSSPDLVYKPTFGKVINPSDYYNELKDDVSHNLLRAQALFVPYENGKLSWVGARVTRTLHLVDTESEAIDGFNRLVEKEIIKTNGVLDTLYVYKLEG